MSNIVKEVYFFICLSLISLNTNATSWIDSISFYGREIYMPAAHYKWDWGQATMLNAIVHQYRLEDEKQQVYFEYIKTAMDKCIHEANGKHPNAIASGHGMAFLAGILGDSEYASAAHSIFKDYLLIPRTCDGGVSHRVESVELWDDTVYMLSMFLFEMYRLTKDDLYIEHFMHQYQLHKAALADEKTGFWVHGWDADNIDYQDRCSQKEWWKLSPERKSTEFWGRGNGWIAMAIADGLRTIPRSSRFWKVLAKELKKLLRLLPDLQDPQTGMWYQLPLRKGEEGNFLESSCTAMFGYAISIGIQEGILAKKKYLPVVQRAYNGLRNNAVELIDSKYLAPSRVCLGTCIGDRDYYYARKQGVGVNYAIGAYIMFGLEFERLKTSVF